MGIYEGGSNEPPFEHPRGNKVKLYQVQCSNESLFVRVLSESELMSLYPDIDCWVSVAHILGLPIYFKRSEFEVCQHILFF